MNYEEMKEDLFTNYKRHDQYENMLPYFNYIEDKVFSLYRNYPYWLNGKENVLNRLRFLDVFLQVYRQPTSQINALLTEVDEGTLSFGLTFIELPLFENEFSPKFNVFMKGLKATDYIKKNMLDELASYTGYSKFDYQPWLNAIKTSDSISTSLDKVHERDTATLIGASLIHDIIFMSILMTNTNEEVVEHFKDDIKLLVPNRDDDYYTKTAELRLKYKYGEHGSWKLCILDYVPEYMNRFKEFSTFITKKEIQ